MKALVASVVLCFAIIGNVYAADQLTDLDVEFLDDRFGVKKADDFANRLTAKDRSKLHDAITARGRAEHPLVRNAIVANQLVAIYRRQCAEWARRHSSPACPPASDDRVQAGKEIADRLCNECHLFGTGDAPAFFGFARNMDLTEQRVAAIGRHDPRMSDIHLSAEEVREVVTYINSLK